MLITRATSTFSFVRQVSTSYNFFFPFVETVVILELERHVWSLFFSLALSVVFLGVCPFPDIVNMHSSIINRFLDFY